MKIRNVIHRLFRKNEKQLETFKKDLEQKQDYYGLLRRMWLFIRVNRQDMGEIVKVKHIESNG